jgi:hypothetical protein
MTLSSDAALDLALEKDLLSGSATGRLGIGPSAWPDTSGGVAARE